MGGIIIDVKDAIVIIPSMVKSLPSMMMFAVMSGKADVRVMVPLVVRLK